MFEIFIIFIFGLSLGSFSNVCIYRLPLNKSLISPSSACPLCNKKIKHIHNIPIFSYLVLRGQSSCCDKRISLHYPLVELFTGFAAVYFFIINGYTLESFFSTLFIMGLVILFFTDLEHYIIPNEITYSFSILAIIISAVNINPFYISLSNSLMGGIISGLLLYMTSKIYFLIRKREGMGMGDVKMIAMIGFWMGLPTTIMIIIASSILGSIVGIVLILFKKIKSNQLIPYGSFLSLTSILIWIYNIISSFYEFEKNFFSFLI